MARCFTLKKKFSVVLVILVLASLFSAQNLSPQASPIVIPEKTYTTVTNPNANTVCKNFYQYLINVGKSENFLSGAFSLDYDLVDNENDYWQYICDYYGEQPSIFSCVNYPDVEIVLDRYKKGSIPSTLFNDLSSLNDGQSNSLMESLGYTDFADGVVHYDATNPDRDMRIYNAYRENLEKVVDYLESLEKAGVDVYLFRPFGEMNNSAFKKMFGATEKGFEAFRNVWKQLWEYVCIERGLTGCLFVFAPVGATADAINYYAGPDYVDIVAPTVYAHETRGGMILSDFGDYEWMRETGRPLGVSETGPRSGRYSQVTVCPKGDYKLILESFLYTFPETSFVVSWFTEAHSMIPNNETINGNYGGEYFMNHPSVINADEMDDFKNETIVDIGVASVFTEKKLKGTEYYLQPGDYTAKDLKKLNISLSKLASADVLFGYGILAYEKDNFSGKSHLITETEEDISNKIKKAKSLKVVKLENLSEMRNIWIDNNASGVGKVNDGKINRFETVMPKDGSNLSIYVELSEMSTVCQASVDMAGFLEDSSFNLRDFNIQVSQDGVSYKTVKKVVGNVFPAVNVTFEPTLAKYIKLVIETPNSSLFEVEKRRVSFTEFSVFGVSSQVYKPDTLNQETIVGNLGENVFVDNSDDIADNIDDMVIPDEKVPDTEKKDNKTPVNKIVIPEFYNYIWIIFCAAIILICGIFWLIAFLRLKRSKNKI